MVVLGWLGGVVVSMSDSKSRDPEFNSQPGNNSGQVVNIHCASVTKQYNLVLAKGR